MDYFTSGYLEVYPVFLCEVLNQLHCILDSYQVGSKMFFGQPIFPVMHLSCLLECMFIPIIILDSVHVCVIVFKAIVMNICSLRSVT